MDLLELRDEIDVIDKQIVELYEKRMDLCSQVAAYKIENGKRVFDRQRENQKLDAVARLTHNDFNARGVKDLFEQIMSISRKLQYQMIAETKGLGKLSFMEMEEIDCKKCRVVFQGAEGAYSQAAMMRYFGDNVSSFNVDTFRDAMLAIDEGSADFAVLPIENSSAGIVSEIYDLLVEFENYIVGEQIIAIEHCLMATPGTQMKDITTVYSHPQSLMQSSHYLLEKGWQQISMKNNAFAAKKVADEKDKTHAAIAGEAAAKAYGLEILERGVNDLKGNSTRFIIATNQKVFAKDASKISLCFEINHESGSLYHALSHLVYNGININKIESRPLTGRNWEYRFFLDFEGNLNDNAVRNALRGLRDETRNMKILGNY
jgi:chorismate mutase/prephenate dehydratase